MKTFETYYEDVTVEETIESFFENEEVKKKIKTALTPHAGKIVKEPSDIEEIVSGIENEGIKKKLSNFLTSLKSDLDLVSAQLSVSKLLGLLS